MPTLGYVSRYALGRDYHKVLRRGSRSSRRRSSAHSASRSHRVFVDSGPVLEKAFARNAGLGWIGKHTNLINRHAGSWFFLGEILTDLPLPRRCSRRPIIAARAARASTSARRRRSSRRTSSTRRAAFPISRSSCATAIPDRVPQGASAIASTAATTASSCAPGTSSRASTRRDATSRRATASTRAKLVELFALERSGVPGAHRRQRDPPHRLRMLAAEHRGRARQRADDATRSSQRSSRGAMIRQRWCASMWSGRWSSTRASGCSPT